MTGALLVTGATGFIGRRVAAMAEASGAPVLNPPRAIVDWRDADAVRDYLALHRPATIIHLASPGVQSRDPHDPGLIEAECAMMRNLLALAGASATIIYGGSMAEYGQSGRLSEDSACTPHNAYAEAKLRAGTLLTEAIATGRAQGLHVRIFGAFGPGEAEKRLFPQLLAALRQGRRALLSDGQQRRDFIHVDDVAAALLHFAATDLPPDPLVNLGTGRSVLLRDAVQKIADALGADPSRLDFGAIARSPHDQDMLEADTARLALRLNPLPPQYFLGDEDVVGRL